jgi:hypothetical protein
MNTTVDDAPIGSTTGSYATYTPTLAQKMWRLLGFRYHLGEEPEGADNMQGWMCTETRLNFGLADRVRLLLTGRLHMRLVQHTTVQVENTKNRFDWQILAPGDRA